MLLLLVVRGERVRVSVLRFVLCVRACLASPAMERERARESEGKPFGFGGERSGRFLLDTRLARRRVLQ